MKKEKKERTRTNHLIAFLLRFAFLLLPCVCLAQTLAPGAPGKDAQWASAGKQAIGTSANLESKIWFTLQNGALTEVYYPDVTVANVHKLEFVVVNPQTKKVETETSDATHEIKATRVDSLSFQQINTAKSGEWKITKTYTTDPDKLAIVMISVQFESKDKSLNLYVYYDASLNNTGMHDNASQNKDSFVSYDSKVYSTLFISGGMSERTSGFFQSNDGLEQLKKDGKITAQYDEAKDGNIIQVAKVDNPSKFTAILSFADNKAGASTLAYLSNAKGFAKCLAEYEKGWSDYVKTLRQVEPKYQAQFNMAAMVLKAQEDKTVRGANVASLTIPWGGGLTANEDVGGGYHLVWSRDLYHVFTAYLALGDVEAANRALDFLFKIQQKPDGSFPQNSQLDGTRGWGSLQLDEVGYPLIMAYQLKRFDKATYENHVKKAADFLVKTGPKTPQERWEEKSGYSPSTIAAEIAGLVCAAEIAKRNNDTASQTIYLATADDWARNVERWTATTKGKYGDGNYYLRLTENGTPDAGEKTVLNNNAGTFLETEIVDAGFLELVRLGIKSPDDPLIVKSLKVIDEKIRVVTPNGESFYRYNNDGYGEMDDGRRWNWDGKYTGKGRLWALLTGERGQYELAMASRIKEKHVEELKTRIEITEQDDRPVYRNIQFLKTANQRLDAMLKFANEGLMIPEQIWDQADTPKNIDKQFIPELKFGEGTGSATPLAWSMAQFIRLAVNLQVGKNLDTPDIVYDRYVKNKIGGQTGLNLSSPTPADLAKLKAGETFTINGTVQPNSTVAYLLGEQRASAKVGADGKFILTVKMPETETIGFLTIVTPDNSSFVSRNKLGGSSKEEKLSAEIVEKVKKSQQSPLIEGNKAIFIYRGAATEVQLAGDFTNWNPFGAVLQDVGENTKAAVLELPMAARVEYKMIVDGKWIADPLNPNKLDNGVGDENSVFTMPGYQAAAWDKESETFKPTLEAVELNSKVFGETRRVQIYVPALSANQSPALPVLYLQDGSDYLGRAKVVQTALDLAKRGKVKPFIIVFVGYKDRTKEYLASDDYAKFLATEVVPAIDKQYNTIKSRDGRAILGASLGGITSVHTALKYPEIFSRIGGQSVSFWVDNERVVKELEMLDGKTKFIFYFDDGTLEGVDDSRRVNVMLRGKGYDVTYVEGETGHNWTSWRDRLADAVIALWK